MDNSRVVLRKGTQRKFLLSLKRKKKLTWKELGALFGVSERTIRIDWKTEKTLITLKAFNQMAEYLNVPRPERLIRKIKGPNWGQVKGASISNAKRYVPIVAERNQVSAELIGAILGDGNIYVNGKRHIYNLRIFANSNGGDKWLAHLGSLIQEILGCSYSIKKKPDRNCVFLTIQSRPAVEALISLGLTPGDKIANGVRIPVWIKKNPDFLKACLRGLLDSDGSVYALAPHNPHLLQISFKSACKPLLIDVRNGFISLGFHPSRISGIAIYLTRQAEIRRLIHEIGFNNPRRLIKLQEFFSSPVV